ncbi:hypothetical protein QBC46DRAFT_457528 [Diplogelasinospora grovesii]|uniref:Auxin efflux carrier superfamily n=1 Tax=Diplogelasinospora grovesii TaxID=303347 RepID=A0AAN6ND39_9PEZI|nr:hypothetical protein QBC46DRAFT_457528 [Diplogelasinospora grovesii]
MSSDIAASFVGAIQASLSVLLTLRLLDENAAKMISKTSVRMFLPMLLITNLGSALELSTVTKYVPILAWALFYNLASLGIGLAATRFFKLPKWVTPAISFNNTTSLPLLLIQSLGSTGTLSLLFKSDQDSVDSVVDRARSYFLVASIIGNTFTFGFGSDLLGAHDEDPADGLDNHLRKQAGYQNGGADGADENGVDDDQEGEGNADERTSLLPGPVISHGRRAARSGYSAAVQLWDKMPAWLQHTVARIHRFISPPAVGALIGIIIGITLPLHRIFFAEAEEGGFFKGWLTSSLKNVGELFVALQVVVVGVKLAQSLRRMRRGEASGKLPWASMLFVIFIRFVFWPVVSIGIITLMASKTNILSDDPVLWFTMMLMPTGPSAMKLTSLADVSEADDEEKMAISKFLSLSYAISPLTSFTIVAAIKACDQWV